MEHRLVHELPRDLGTARHHIDLEFGYSSFDFWGRRWHVSTCCLVRSVASAPSAVLVDRLGSFVFGARVWRSALLRVAEPIPATLHNAPSSVVVADYTDCRTARPPCLALWLRARAQRAAVVQPLRRGRMLLPLSGQSRVRLLIHIPDSARPPSHAPKVWEWAWAWCGFVSDLKRAQAETFMHVIHAGGLKMAALCSGVVCGALATRGGELPGHARARRGVLR